ncbi:MAG: MCE family protein, partial [Actinobacteria bacterium]|nr:MCE family protein [Actinomycetota bacterium]
LPLLTAVQPAQLNATLTAVAQALNGRGNNLGQTLVNLDNYLKVLEPHTTALVDDLKQLGQVALALCAMASWTVYGLLNEYSPEFTCLFQGIANLYDKTSAAISDNRIHLSITVQTGTFQTQPYTPGQEPKLVTGYGPNCFGLPNSPTPVNGSGYFQIPSKYTCLNDGAALTATGEQANCAAATSSATNSPEETAMVNSILAAQMHTTPNKVPGVSTLLMAPLLRGQEVTVK